MSLLFEYVCMRLPIIPWSGSAFEPGASGIPYYCTSICARACCTWRASCVDLKTKKVCIYIAARRRYLAVVHGSTSQLSFLYRSTQAYLRYVLRHDTRMGPDAQRHAATTAKCIIEFSQRWCRVPVESQVGLLPTCGGRRTKK